jgi:hypothetical protein
MGAPWQHTVAVETRYATKATSRHSLQEAESLEYATIFLKPLD